LAKLPIHSMKLKVKQVREKQGFRGIRMGNSLSPAIQAWITADKPVADQQYAFSPEGICLCR
jgi:hypothetical protein